MPKSVYPVKAARVLRAPLCEPRFAPGGRGPSHQPAAHALIGTSFAVLLVTFVVNLLAFEPYNPYFLVSGFAAQAKLPWPVVRGTAPGPLLPSPAVSSGQEARASFRTSQAPNTSSLAGP